MVFGATRVLSATGAMVWATRGRGLARLGGFEWRRVAKMGRRLVLPLLGM